MAEKQLYSPNFSIFSADIEGQLPAVVEEESESDEAVVEQEQPSRKKKKTAHVARR